jgi:transposase
VQARHHYRQQIARHPCERLKFVDESGVNIAMTRRYGRAPRGKRVYDAVPKNFGRNITVLGALSCHGLEAVMTVDGATDTAVFRAYVTHVLVPTLASDDVVVMDNLSAHKLPDIEKAIQATGAQLVFLPPYSPDFSPIEECWSKIKEGLRARKARTRNALDHALNHLIDTVNHHDVHGWFAHCGYPLR